MRTLSRPPANPMSHALAVLLLSLVLVCCQAADVLEPFSYRDTESALRCWKPQFGSLPARAETLPDGSSCMAFDADFTAPNARACWDWTGKLDLSSAGRVAFQACSTNPGVAGTVALYFGTPGGWYGGFWSGLQESWTTRTLATTRFGIEGAPEGWDKITTVRFSVWASGPGKATFRVRNLRVLPRDPAENLLRNGSFEVPGPFPYGWGSGHWGVGNLPWAADMDLFRRHFHQDTTAAREGRQSLCLDNTADLPLLKAQSVWVNLPRDCPAYVVSAWLRSDQDQLPVVLECNGRQTTATASKEWVQAQLKGVQPGERVCVNIAPQAPGRLWVDCVQVQAVAEATAEFHASPEDEALMEREARVDWSPSRRTADIAAGRRITGPVQPATVAVDANGRFTVNGVPYLQHSLGLEFVSDLGMINVVADAGFRDITIEVRAGITTEQLRAIFDRCAEVGLRVIPWLDGNIPLERFSSHITTLRNHPALLCWYVYDEPSGDRFAEADARYKLARELDPSHPALINYLSNRLQEQTGDIYSTDVYPIPHATPSTAIGAVAAMKAAAAKLNRPVWMWLQGTGYAYWMDREPTPRELSCMVYGSLIRGARGIYYFAQIPRTHECLAEMRALCVEMDALAPALGSLDPAPEVTCSAPTVLCKAFAVGGQWWVTAVNTSNAPMQANFTVSGAPGDADVLFEGRRVSVAGGKWSDDFGVYERHVYKLAP
jgi:hypothetical protein